MRATQGRLASGGTGASRRLSAGYAGNSSQVSGPMRRWKRAAEYTPRVQVFVEIGKVEVQRGQSRCSLFGLKTGAKRPNREPEGGLEGWG